jgi:hypothetical protein
MNEVQRKKESSVHRGRSSSEFSLDVNESLQLAVKKCQSAYLFEVVRGSSPV